MTIEENKINEAVKQAIKEQVEKGHLISIDDVEAVEKSPAGRLLIIESDVKYLKQNNATKEDLNILKKDLQNCATKEDLNIVKNNVFVLKSDITVIKKLLYWMLGIFSTLFVGLISAILFKMK